MAMKAHLEARQLSDLGKDLARRILPSEGPFSPGERVFFWSKDHSKIKEQGRWYQGKVISQTGPMVLIQTINAVVQINQSKVKRDHDGWHDVPLPPSLEQAEPIAASAARSSASAEPSAPVLWLMEDKGPLDVLEVFSGSANLSAACAVAGLRVGPPIDIKTGYDLLTLAGQAAVWDLVVKRSPRVISLLLCVHHGQRFRMLMTLGRWHRNVVAIFPWSDSAHNWLRTRCRRVDSLFWRIHNRLACGPPIV